MFHSAANQAFQLSTPSWYQAPTSGFSIHEYQGTSQNCLGYRRPKYKPVFPLCLGKALSHILIVLLSRLVITCLSSPVEVLTLKHFLLLSQFGTEECRGKMVSLQVLPFPEVLPLSPSLSPHKTHQNFICPNHCFSFLPIQTLLRCEWRGSRWSRLFRAQERMTSYIQPTAAVNNH